MWQYGFDPEEKQQHKKKKAAKGNIAPDEDFDYPDHVTLAKEFSWMADLLLWDTVKAEVKAKDKAEQDKLNHGDGNVSFCKMTDLKHSFRRKRDCGH